MKVTMVNLPGQEGKRRRMEMLIVGIRMGSSQINGTKEDRVCIKIDPCILFFLLVLFYDQKNCKSVYNVIVASILRLSVMQKLRLGVMNNLHHDAVSAPEPS